MTAQLSLFDRPQDSYAGACEEMRRDPAMAGWLELPGFRDRTVDGIARKVDDLAREGACVLPPPADVLNAFRLTPLHKVKVVILGQDPYPTPGDAHGLAFSTVGRRIPPSLRRILQEAGDDLGIPRPGAGDLSGWARQGVLLLNTALTVEAGKAGAHLKLGWSEIADQAIRLVSDAQQAVVFILWGAPARERGAGVDRARHLVIETGHPSPLNRTQPFLGTRPFSRANDWLVARGIPPVEWAIP